MPAKKKEDPELDALVAKLEECKNQPEVFGAAPGDAKAIDPATIFALIELVLKLVERFRKK